MLSLILSKRKINLVRFTERRVCSLDKKGILCRKRQIIKAYKSRKQNHSVISVQHVCTFNSVQNVFTMFSDWFCLVFYVINSEINRHSFQ